MSQPSDSPGSPASGPRFWCHACQEDVGRLRSGADLRCPTCASDFLEELPDDHGSADDAANSNHDDHDHDHNPWAGNPLASLLGMGGGGGSSNGPGVQFAYYTGTIGPDGIRSSSGTFGPGGATSSSSSRPTRSGSGSSNRRSSNRPQQEQQQQQTGSAPLDPISTFLDVFMGRASGTTSPIPFAVPGIPLMDLLFSGFAGSSAGAGPGTFSLGDFAFGKEQIDRIATQLMDQTNTQQHRAPPEFIEQLPQVEIVEAQVDKALDCVVCQDKFTLGETVTKLPCDHLFHKDCIVPWMERNVTCPTCRADVVKEWAENKQKTPRGESGRSNSRGGNGAARSSASASVQPVVPGSWVPDIDPVD
ncbi:hypothetical protein AMAG_13948 [Allomyces macrogynus ATCC 38327]|uniref:RING-type E3 ubiquitin transferase n=1 Tax=Allomyces macrogynus (strain ATCC 38327) TaxID=578462 RepID=A0A0L0T2Z4_ALLM3|nr:hypothetical protein AMAG_13948 [Allomyces macrogynus ATCC 38327]|eukprot:KNE69077.1 hypothetical protein AMAG_13948 [Allomyces macrogynus ATCC 38327]